MIEENKNNFCELWSIITLKLFLKQIKLLVLKKSPYHLSFHLSNPFTMMLTLWHLKKKNQTSRASLFINPIKNSHLPKRQSSNSLSEHIRHSVAKPQPTFLATFLIQLLISFYPLIHLLFSTSNYTKLHDLQFLINARIFHAALLFHTLLLLPKVLFPSLFA